MQTDPIGYADGMNLYTYVGNNPINWIDPFGKYAEVSFDPRNNELFINIPITYNDSKYSDYENKINKAIEEAWSGNFDTGLKVTTKVIKPSAGSITNTIDLVDDNIETDEYGNTYRYSFIHREKDRSDFNTGKTGEFDINMKLNTFAHEAGHLIGLEEGYYFGKRKKRKPLPGYETNIMYWPKWYGVELINFCDIVDMYYKNGTLKLIDGNKKYDCSK